MTYGRIILTCFLVQVFTTHVANSFVPFYPNTNAVGTTRTSRRVPCVSLSASKRDLDFEELQEAAKSSASFEAYALQKDSVKDKETVEPQPAKPTNGPKGKEKETAEPPPAKPTNGKGYVPIEVWEEQRKKDNASSEERVQFEARVNGDRFKQNEILRKNLNGD